MHPVVACPRCGSTDAVESSWGLCPVCVLAFGASDWLTDSGTSTQPDLGSALPSGRFGDYELLGEIGQGGMGVVYRARQVSLGRWVALKMIRSGLLATDAEVRRFRTEAATVARLRHPGIVAVYEAGEVEGQHYFSMDLVEGRSLDQCVAESPLPPTEAARVVEAVAEAIHFAHGLGVLHRDLKPANVMLDPEGRPRVLDFGLARGPVSGAAPRTDPTVTGTVVGSPAYLPPEQAVGRWSEVGVRSDVYALGTILYELLTGRAPFRAATLVETLRLVTEAEPVAPRELNPGLPRDLETICLRCLAKRPTDRYASAADLAAELGRFRRGEPVLARPVSGPERLLRWGRRHPGLAAVSAAAISLLVLVATVSLVAAVRIEAARVRVAAAEGEAREQLRRALLAQARASRFTGRMGQRADAERAAREAARIRPGQDATEERVAALALPEVSPGPRWKLERPGARIALDPDRDRYLTETSTPGLELHANVSNTVLATLDTGGQRVRGFPLFAPDGRRVAARLADDSLRVWNLPGGTVSQALTNRPYPDNPRTTRFGEDLVWAPSGEWLGVGHPGGGWSAVSTETGQELWRWTSPLVPRRAAVSPDGTQVVVADFTDESANTFVVLLDARTGKETRRLAGISGTRGLAFAPDGRRLAVARGGRVEVLRLPGGEQFRRLETPDGPAMDLAWDPTGEWLLTHSSRSVFRWWAVREGRVALELTDPVALTVKVAVSSDFGRVATVAPTEQAGELRFEPSAVYRVIRPPEAAANQLVGSAIGTVDFSAEGAWILVACLDEVHVRGTADGALVARLMRPTQSDWLTARFGADRTVVYVSSRGEGLWRYRLAQDAAGRWNFDAGTKLPGEADFMLCSLHRPSGRLALASARKHRAFRLYSPEGGTPDATWAAGQAYEASFSPDGRWVAANSVPAGDADAARRVEIRDATTGAVVRVLEAPWGATARWSGDGRWLLTASQPQSVNLWRTADWSRGPTLPKEVQNADGTFALSPDGRWLAAFNEVEVFLIRTEDGQVVTRLIEPPGTLGYVTDMAFSPDSRTLALLRRNAVLGLWSIPSVLE
jgi:WD40 repeat protein